MTILNAVIRASLYSVCVLAGCNNEEYKNYKNISTICNYKDNHIEITSKDEENSIINVIITPDFFTVDGLSQDKIEKIPWDFVDTIASESKIADGSRLTSISYNRKLWIVGALDADCYDKFLNLVPRRIGVITVVTIR